MDFRRPGKPTDNCLAETPGSFRDECLNVHWFEALDEAKSIVEARRKDYNESRLDTPHNGKRAVVTVLTGASWSA